MQSYLIGNIIIYVNKIIENPELQVIVLYIFLHEAKYKPLNRYHEDNFIYHLRRKQVLHSKS